ncbi:hypothetical protein EDB85DRAFT_2209077 [Lactarius pseudohatsudake]|nr:hypothetical protein EDB85DRAFT_2209077 [Lactarius pseudohatsudake]
METTSPAHHCHKQLLQCSPESSWDFVLIGGPEFSTQLRVFSFQTPRIVPGNGWNSSPFPSMTHQDKNGLYPPTIGEVTDTTIMNSYIPLFGPSPDHHPNILPVRRDAMVDRTLRDLFPYVLIPTHPNLRTVLVHQHPSRCSTGGVPMQLCTMSQKTNQAAWTHNEGEHLPEGSRHESKKETVLSMTQFLYVSFVQRQGLRGTVKISHKPKKGDGFCVEFTWPQGRRYIYRRHLREEHPGVVSPTQIACGGVN